MPDLHRVLTCTCPTNMYFVRLVESSNGQARYEVSFTKEESWRCTCPGFKYRGKCKHIDKVAPQRCGGLWDAFANTIYKFEYCPDCGEKTVPFYVGV